MLRFSTATYKFSITMATTKQILYDAQENVVLYGKIQFYYKK